MLKESTMRRYSVKQLARHLHKHSDLFYYEWNCGDLLIEEKHVRFFYCKIIDQHKDHLIELIKEHT